MTLIYGEHGPTVGNFLLHQTLFIFLFIFNPKSCFYLINRTYIRFHISLYNNTHWFLLKHCRSLARSRSHSLSFIHIHSLNFRQAQLATVDAQHKHYGYFNSSITNNSCGISYCDELHLGVSSGCRGHFKAHRRHKALQV